VLGVYFFKKGVEGDIKTYCKQKDKLISSCSIDNQKERYSWRKSRPHLGLVKSPSRGPAEVAVNGEERKRVGQKVRGKKNGKKIRALISKKKGAGNV